MRIIIKKISSIFIAGIFLFPIGYTALHSFMEEMQILNDGIDILPKVFNLTQYYNLVSKNSQYFALYINSVKITALIVLGQIFISIGAAYFLARSKHKFKNFLFFLYIFLMILPLQITLIPNALLYNYIEDLISIKIFDTHMSVILPGIFNTFGVFFLKQFFQSIPEEYYDMAKIDGASNLEIIIKVIIPYSIKPILLLCVLIFIDYWNMIEQGLIFINTIGKMPLAIYLNMMYSNMKSIFYAGGMLFMLPVIYIAVKSKDIIQQWIEGAKL